MHGSYKTWFSIVQSEMKTLSDYQPIQNITLTRKCARYALLSVTFSQNHRQGIR